MKFKRSHSHQQSITQWSFLVLNGTKHFAESWLVIEPVYAWPRFVRLISNCLRPQVLHHQYVAHLTQTWNRRKNNFLWISCAFSLFLNPATIPTLLLDSHPMIRVLPCNWKNIFTAPLHLWRKRTEPGKGNLKKKSSVGKSGTKAAHFPELLNRPAATEPLVPVSCQQSFHFGKKKKTGKHRVRSRPPNPRNAGQRPWRLVAPKHSLHHESNLTSLPTKPKILCSKIISPLYEARKACKEPCLVGSPTVAVHRFHIPQSHSCSATIKA